MGYISGMRFLFKYTDQRFCSDGVLHQPVDSNWCFPVCLDMAFAASIRSYTPQSTLILKKGLNVQKTGTMGIAASFYPYLLNGSVDYMRTNYLFSDPLDINVAREICDKNNLSYGIEWETWHKALGWLFANLRDSLDSGADIHLLYIGCDDRITPTLEDGRLVDAKPFDTNIVKDTMESIQSANVPKVLKFNVPELYTVPDVRAVKQGGTAQGHSCLVVGLSTAQSIFVVYNPYDIVSEIPIARGGMGCISPQDYDYNSFLYYGHSQADQSLYVEFGTITSFWIGTTQGLIDEQERRHPFGEHDIVRDFL
jgi:hypothetical protein